MSQEMEILQKCLSPKAFRFVDKWPFLSLVEQFPLAAEALADLRVVHLGVLERHASPLAPGPHHERVHRPLDVEAGGGRVEATRPRRVDAQHVAVVGGRARGPRLMLLEKSPVLRRPTHVHLSLSPSCNTQCAALRLFVRHRKNANEQSGQIAVAILYCDCVLHTGAALIELFIGHRC
jgi:hypothetical protein